MNELNINGNKSGHMRLPRQKNHANGLEIMKLNIRDRNIRYINPEEKHRILGADVNNNLM